MQEEGGGGEGGEGTERRRRREGMAEQRWVEWKEES
jgi:hypothetical protein